MDSTPVQHKGRFAPSPTGRMHLGNLFTALVSWLSVKSKGGKWILRIEDLDPQRSRTEYAEQIEDDLRFLGLVWDEGGIEDTINNQSYQQSKRGDIYEQYLDRLIDTGLTYPCFCSKADIRASQAPHASDGRIIYPGTCRPAGNPPFKPSLSHFLSESSLSHSLAHSVRIFVPDKEIHFYDSIFGRQTVNPAQEYGDFVIQRADGAWAYQFAVVVDDALMGVTEIVRGADLLGSSAPQIYLYNILGFTPPEFCHIPLICNSGGIRLSKRDSALSMDTLRSRYSAEQIIGYLAYLAGQLPEPEPITPRELIPIFDLRKIHAQDKIILPESLTL